MEQITDVVKEETVEGTQKTNTVETEEDIISLLKITNSYLGEMSTYMRDISYKMIELDTNIKNVKEELHIMQSGYVERTSLRDVKETLKSIKGVGLGKSLEDIDRKLTEIYWKIH